MHSGLTASQDKGPRKVIMDLNVSMELYKERSDAKQARASEGVEDEVPASNIAQRVAQSQTRMCVTCIVAKLR